MTSNMETGEKPVQFPKEEGRSETQFPDTTVDLLGYSFEQPDGYDDDTPPFALSSHDVSLPIKITASNITSDSDRQHSSLQVSAMSASYPRSSSRSDPTLDRFSSFCEKGVPKSFGSETTTASTVVTFGDHAQGTSSVGLMLVSSSGHTAPGDSVIGRGRSQTCSDYSDGNNSKRGSSSSGKKPRVIGTTPQALDVMSENSVILDAAEDAISSCAASRSDAPFSHFATSTIQTDQHQQQFKQSTILESQNWLGSGLSAGLSFTMQPSQLHQPQYRQHHPSQRYHRLALSSHSPSHLCLKTTEQTLSSQTANESFNFSQLMRQADDTFHHIPKSTALSQQMMRAVPETNSQICNDDVYRSANFHACPNLLMSGSVFTSRGSPHDKRMFQRPSFNSNNGGSSGGNMWSRLTNRLASSLWGNRMAVQQQNGLVNDGDQSTHFTANTIAGSNSMQLQTILTSGQPQSTDLHDSNVNSSISNVYTPFRTASWNIGVHTQRTGKDSFQVSTHVRRPCAVRDVMEIVGNPDLLRIWCDPITAVFVTDWGDAGGNTKTKVGGYQSPLIDNEDEGGLIISYGDEESGGIKDRNQRVDSAREYDGEWIEATTSALMPPTNQLSCLCSCFTMSRACLGFPSTGSMTMFIEKSRGQVGLTIGPFSGGVIVNHTINVHAMSVTSGSGVTIVDEVQLSREDGKDQDDWCRWFDCFGGLDLATQQHMSGYMNQTASSIDKLRCLVENRDTAASGGRGTMSVDFDEENGNTPLLG